jgi:oligopeptide transport system substrate-binding protein
MGSLGINWIVSGERGLASALVVVALVLGCASPIITPTPTPAVTPASSQTPQPTASPTPSPSPLELAADQVLRLYCCATDPRSFRPQAASGIDELSIINGLQRGLLYRDSAGNLVPELATDLPTVSADGLTYTYHLRKDALYSDGTPVVAGDIVRAARQLADPRNAFDYGYEMCFVAGAQDVLGKDFGCSTDKRAPYERINACDADPSNCKFDDATVDGLLDSLGVTAPDDHTVIFKLYQPTSFWPDITASWLLTPVPPAQTSWAEAGDIISSGPFVLSEWRHNNKVVLTPNPNWYGLEPPLQKIEINIGGDPARALGAWEAGDLDEVRVPTSEVSGVLATPEYASMVKRTSTLSVEYWDFANCLSTDATTGMARCPTNDAVTSGIAGHSPMQNKNFRQALTQATDRADLIDQAFLGIGTPAYSPTMPGIPGFPTITADDTPLPFDPDAALLKLNTALGELGVAQPDEADVSPATDECNSECQQTKAWARMLGGMRFYYNCDAGHDARAKYLADHWRDALGFSGAQFDLRCIDFAFFPGRPPLRTWNADVARDGWAADFPNPDNQNRSLFTCGGSFNDSTYCNPAYDALLDQGARAADDVASVPFYHQAEQLLVEDAPALFLRYGETVSLIRPWVTGLVQTPSDQMNAGDNFYETIQIAAH